MQVTDDEETNVLHTCELTFLSFISAITILGTPSEMYVFGTQYWLIGLAYPFVLAATAHIYMPVFYGLQHRSAHQYLELRFNRAVRTFAAGVRVTWVMHEYQD